MSSVHDMCDSLLGDLDNVASWVLDNPLPSPLLPSNPDNPVPMDGPHSEAPPAYTNSLVLLRIAHRLAISSRCLLMVLFVPFNAVRTVLHPI